MVDFDHVKSAGLFLTIKDMSRLFKLSCLFLVVNVDLPFSCCLFLLVDIDLVKNAGLFLTIKDMSRLFILSCLFLVVGVDLPFSTCLLQNVQFGGDLPLLGEYHCYKPWKMTL